MMKLKTVELKTIKETTKDYEGIEREIKRVFRKLLYTPLLQEIGEPKKTLTNAREDLLFALQSGRIQFHRGRFTGKLNATLTKELKAIGAKWDAKTQSFKLLSSDLPLEARNAVSSSHVRFEQQLSRIDAKIAKILPAEIAEHIKVSEFFESALGKVDKDFRTSVARITIEPALTPRQKKQIADEWQENMELWIKDFSEKEIGELRQNIKKTIFSGTRSEALVATIKKSYGVTENKAKFLARQETSLLMTKYKQTRYEDAGVDEYKWGCVAGTKNHPVRPWHKALEGKTFSWQNPPVTTKPGEPQRRNNPGQDYNCRCFARPIVTFKVDTTKK